MEEGKGKKGREESCVINKVSIKLYSSVRMFVAELPHIVVRPAPALYCTN